MTVVRAVVGSIVLAASGASAGAQSLAPGMWTGTLKVVGGPQLPVEFVVDSDDSSQITMKTTTGPIAPVTDVRLNTRGMVFQWTVFACALNQKKAGQYEG
ncbi:MAG: hypothetical protein HY560_02085, partial [Gemmatimonadetes bacterium]|nr:hypothetical protein [Gemmatimonadota bacterium]